MLKMPGNIWNEYSIIYIEPITDDFDEDTPILIQYGAGSEAEVFLHEIVRGVLPI
jgi:hypothetical protein